MKRTKKILLTTILTVMMLCFVFPQNVYAAKKPKLSPTKKTVYVGKTVTIKLKNNKKKVKWSVSNKKIKITKKSKTYVKIKGLKKGTSYVKAKIGKKTYKCKITVKSVSKNVAGSRENPLSAYSEYTANIYDYGTYLGKFRIQLLDYKDGEEAWELVSKNEFNEKPSASQEYIYVKFKITYLSGEKQVDATEIVNHYSNFFNTQSNYKLENIDWAFGFEDVEDMANVSLYPGGSAVCSQAILIRAGNTPITYRLETGYDSKKYEAIYTWFTTKR